MKRIEIIALLIIFATAAFAVAQDEGADYHYRSIPAIKMNPVEGRTAEIIGRVAGVYAAPDDKDEESFFYLRDESGDSIRVVTNGQPPAVGLTLRVTGRVAFVREPNREVILVGQSWDEPSEDQLLPKDEFDAGTTAPEGVEPSTIEDEVEEQGGIDPLLLAVIALVLAGGLAFAAFFIYRWLTTPSEAEPVEGEAEPEESLEELLSMGEEEEAAEGEEPEEEAEALGLSEEEEEAIDSGEEVLEEDEIEAADEPLPESEPSEEEPVELNEVSGDIVRTNYPSPEDEFFYPGRLEVVAGETELTELLFRLPKGLPDAVFTYDSRDLSDAGHFFINHESVGTKQAKIILEVDSYILVNLAGDNPTTHNGRAMDKAERVELNDGDTVGIGVLQVVFRSGSAEVHAEPAEDEPPEQEAEEPAADEADVIAEEAPEEPATDEGEEPPADTAAEETEPPPEEPEMETAEVGEETAAESPVEEIAAEVEAALRESEGEEVPAEDTIPPDDSEEKTE